MSNEPSTSRSEEITFKEPNFDQDVTESPVEMNEGPEFEFSNAAHSATSSLHSADSPVDINHLADVANEEHADFQASSVTTTVKRRPSIRPALGGYSLAPLSGKDDFIPPPIPESLPTTPGYEINEKMFQDSFNLKALPKQQIPIRPSIIRKESKPSDMYSLDSRASRLSNTNSMSRVISRLTQLAQRVDNADEADVVDEDGPGIMTIHNPPKNKHRVISACLWIFVAGLSDAAPGALLPHMESYYNITYSIVSLIWMANAVGYIAVALFASKLDKKLGKRNGLIVGAISSFICYLLTATGTKFPVICVGFIFGGIGIAINISNVNVFLSRLDKSSLYLGYFHGTYGIGATISPLIATAMIDKGIPWYRYYWILFGLMVINCFNLAYSFNGADQDLKPWDHQEELHNEDQVDKRSPPMTPQSEMALNDLLPSGNSVPDSPELPDNNNDFEPTIPKGDMKLALKNYITWMISFFVFFYGGGEVSMGGWIVTFLLDYRHGNSSSVGYVASGYWVGLTIGRFLLTSVLAKFLGARRAVFALICSSIAFIVLTWIIPNVIVAGTTVSIAGIFIGPMYPLMISLAAKVLPKKIQVVSLTIMTAFGSSGGALHPFLVGLISQFAGTYVVMPYFIGCFSAMSIFWLALPKIEKKYYGRKWWQKVLAFI